MKIKDTTSVCPECLKIIPAEIYEKKNIVWISKTCPQHGETVEKYWEDYKMYDRASKFAREGKGIHNPNVRHSGNNCPFECGLCKRHKSHTALANVVLTNRCDLACWYCFFYAKKGEKIYEPTLEQFRTMFRVLRAEKPIATNAIQLTGGEPTLREDLIDIIKLAREEGFQHVQLNTNGIRLANDPTLAKEVRGAGVNTIYLSFDGVTTKTNPKNHDEVYRAIDNCRKAGLGIVLVPTVIKGINDHQIGRIIKFATDNIDVIRGVNFQPVSLVGRMPKTERERMRITIPSAIKKIEKQTHGSIIANDFFPVPCVGSITEFVEAMTERPNYDLSTHFACGMATYLIKDGDRLVPITRFVDVEGLFKYLSSKAIELKKGKSKLLMTAKLLLKINSFIDKDKQPKGFRLGKMLFNALIKHDYKALGEFHRRTLFLGFMHFQDPYNYDIERVERCAIHYAMPDGRIVPFCAFNVFPQVYRDSVQDRYSLLPAEWERKTGKRLKDDVYKRVTK